MLQWNEICDLNEQELDQAVRDLLRAPLEVDAEVMAEDQATLPEDILREAWDLTSNSFFQRRLKSVFRSQIKQLRKNLEGRLSPEDGLHIMMLAEVAQHIPMQDLSSDFSYLTEVFLEEVEIADDLNARHSPLNVSASALSSLFQLLHSWGETHRFESNLEEFLAPNQASELRYASFAILMADTDNLLTYLSPMIEADDPALGILLEDVCRNVDDLEVFLTKVNLLPADFQDTFYQRLQASSASADWDEIARVRHKVEANVAEAGLENVLAGQRLLVLQKLELEEYLWKRLRDPENSVPRVQEGQSPTDVILQAYNDDAASFEFRINITETLETHLGKLVSDVTVEMEQIEDLEHLAHLLELTHQLNMPTVSDSYAELYDALDQRLIERDLAPEEKAVMGLVLQGLHGREKQGNEVLKTIDLVNVLNGPAVDGRWAQHALGMVALRSPERAHMLVPLLLEKKSMTLPEVRDVMRDAGEEAWHSFWQWSKGLPEEQRQELLDLSKNRLQSSAQLPQPKTNNRPPKRQKPKLSIVPKS